MATSLKTLIYIFLFSVKSVSAAPDCGPQSLILIYQHFFNDTDCDTLEKIKNISGTSNSGTTLLGLFESSKKLGLPVISLKLNPKQYRKINSPMIAWMEDNHFLVVWGCKWFGTQVIIQDYPHEKQVIKMRDFASHWSGVALVYSDNLHKELEKERKSDQISIYPGPHISVEKEVLFLGTVNEGELISGIFALTNTGADTLKISFRPSCGCTVGKISKPLMLPGESCELEIIFNTSGRAGHQKQGGMLITNDPERKYINLMLALTVSGKSSRLTSSPPIP